MKTNIWKQAIKLVEEGKVSFEGIIRDSLSFQVNEQFVKITKDKGTYQTCTCENGSLKWETLCSHKIAVMIYYTDYLKKRSKQRLVLPK